MLLNDHPNSESPPKNSPEWKKKTADQKAQDQFPGILIYGADRRLRYVNEKAARLLGFQSDRFIDRRDEELVAPEICNQYLPILERSYQSLQEQSLVVSLTESRREVDILYLPVVNAKREVYQVIGVISDISDRKSHCLFQDIPDCQMRQVVSTGAVNQDCSFLETIGDAFVSLDRDARITYINTHGIRIAKMKREELIGQCVWKLFPRAIPLKFYSEYYRAVQSGTSMHFEEFYPDPLNVWLECHCYPYADGVSVFLRDITERKQSEKALQQSQEALRQLNETLEQQVVERTALAETRAKQLQALAVELIESEERERRRISQILHDDLQQVLAAAKMQLQAALRKLPPNNFLDNVIRLLEESIGKSRRLSHELSPPELFHSGLIASLHWLAGVMQEQFGLTVELNGNKEDHFENEVLKVFLVRAVQELLFNIVKHSGVKKARVVIEDCDDALRIVVSDKGKGFDAAILNGCTACNAVGLGLLSLRERAKYIGGSLEIDSAPGKGCRFTLLVPRRPFNTDKTNTFPFPDGKRQSSSMDGIPSALDSKIRVLFVDDHKLIRQGMIRMIAEQPDIQLVAEASNGLQSVELARLYKPDVVVMDVSMPDMDGIEATRLIKAELPAVRVIGLSMHEDERLVRDMKAAGAEAFLSKTVSTAELLRAIYGIEAPEI